MNTMTISPYQDEYVTRKEFGQFRDDVNHRFDRVDVRLDELKSDIVIMKGDIVTMKGDIVTMKSDIFTMKGDIAVLKGDMNTVKGDLALFKDEIISQFNRTAGMIREQTREDIKIATEYLVSVIDARLPAP